MGLQLVRKGGRLAVDVVLGTRPEAVKCAPVIRALREDARLRVRVVSTGQHREMLETVLTPFGLRPDVDLDVMRPGQGLNGLVARIVPLLEAAFAAGAPDLVLVQGDTTSAFCAGLAAFHGGIAVGHIEAGLRSFDRRAPFPEEANRRMLTALADLHFAPTAASRAQLVREGIAEDDVFLCGNTGIDALLEILARPDSTAFSDRAAGSDRHAASVLITLHRRENWMPSPSGAAADGDSPLAGVLSGIASAARARPEVDFVFPVHKSPPVRAAVARHLEGLSNVRLLEPLPYAEFVAAMARASVILTDSGGVQEEAPSLGVPVLVARSVTERPEGVAAGLSRLVGSDPQRIASSILAALQASRPAQGTLPRPSPYGDGRAAQRIRAAILHRAGLGARPEDFSCSLTSPALGLSPLRPVNS